MVGCRWRGIGPLGAVIQGGCVEIIGSPLHNYTIGKSCTCTAPTGRTVIATLARFAPRCRTCKERHRRHQSWRALDDRRTWPSPSSSTAQRLQHLIFSVRVVNYLLPCHGSAGFGAGQCCLGLEGQRQRLSSVAETGVERWICHRRFEYLGPVDHRNTRQSDVAAWGCIDLRSANSQSVSVAELYLCRSPLTWGVRRHARGGPVEADKNVRYCHYRGGD